MNKHVAFLALFLPLAAGLFGACGAPQDPPKEGSQGAQISPADPARFSPEDLAILREMGADPTSLAITEFVVVNFPEERRVLIDGNPVGTTGSLIFVDGGVHVITLEGDGYEPSEIVHVFRDTTVSLPFTAEFQPTSQ